MCCALESEGSGCDVMALRRPKAYDLVGGRERDGEIVSASELLIVMTVLSKERNKILHKV